MLQACLHCSQTGSLPKQGHATMPALAVAPAVDVVDVEEPWKTPNAAELDAITFQSWCVLLPQQCYHSSDRRWACPAGSRCSGVLLCRVCAHAWLASVRVHGCPIVCRLEKSSDDKFARDLLAAIEPLGGGALGGIRPGWVSVLHVARQMKSAPQAEEPERYLFWGAAGQFVDHLSKVS